MACHSSQFEGYQSKSENHRAECNNVTGVVFTFDIHTLEKLHLLQQEKPQMSIHLFTSGKIFQTFSHENLQLNQNGVSERIHFWMHPYVNGFYWLKSMR